MKKFIIALLALAAVSTVPASAQFRRGFTAGVNYTDLRFKYDLVDVSQTVGYTAGVTGEMMFPGIGFGIDLGLLYEKMGAKINLGQKTVWSSLGYGNENVMLHYIHIPVHLRFKWTRMNGFEEKLAPFIFGGPDFTILAGHSNASAFKCAGGELGLTAGAGVELFRRWQVSATYTWGMTYALKTKLLDDYSARNRAWTVRVTYLF